MERLIAFDYLHDPLPQWAAMALRWRVPRRSRPATLALLVSGIAMLSCIAIQHERLVRADRARAEAQATLDGTHARLKLERVAAADVKSLLGLDDAIRAFRASGYHRAQALATFAARLPERSWLTRLSPVQGSATVAGSAETLGAIGEMLDNLGEARFGRVTLQRVTRIERPRSRAIFDFTLKMERL